MAGGMAHIDRVAREIVFKIAWCGIHHSGRSTSLSFIYPRVPRAGRSPLRSDGESLSFSFQPLILAGPTTIRPRYHLQTGSLRAGGTEEPAVKDADGLVWVVDSRAERLAANLEASESLHAWLARHHPQGIPQIIQYNHRDRPTAMDLGALRAHLNPRTLPDFETVARTGFGLAEATKSIIRLIKRGQAVQGDNHALAAQGG